MANPVEGMTPEEAKEWTEAFARDFGASVQYVENAGTVRFWGQEEGLMDFDEYMQSQARVKDYASKGLDPNAFNPLIMDAMDSYDAEGNIITPALPEGAEPLDLTAFEPWDPNKAFRDEALDFGHPGFYDTNGRWQYIPEEVRKANIPEGKYWVDQPTGIGSIIPIGSVSAGGGRYIDEEGYHMPDGTLGAPDWEWQNDPNAPGGGSYQPYEHGASFGEELLSAGGDVIRAATGQTALEEGLDPSGAIATGLIGGPMISGITHPAESMIGGAALAGITGTLPTAMGGGAAGAAGAGAGAGAGAAGAGAGAGIGPGLAALGSLGSTYLGYEAAGEAAETAAAAQMYAADLQQQQYEQTRADLAPYRQVGAEALGQAAEYGQSQVQEGDYIPASAVPEYGAMDFDIYKDPSYEFRREEALRGIDRAAGATGGITSGKRLEDIMTRAGDLASQEYAAARGRYVQDYGIQRQNEAIGYGRGVDAYGRAYGRETDYLNRLASLYGTGAGAAQVTGQLGASAASNIGQAAIGAGQAQAAGQIGQAGALTGGIGDLTALYTLGGQQPIVQPTYGGYNPSDVYYNTGTFVPGNVDYGSVPGL